jgi:D-sedoheptulose 7-phosphate isomerase
VGRVLPDFYRVAQCPTRQNVATRTLSGGEACRAGHHSFCFNQQKAVSTERSRIKPAVTAELPQLRDAIEAAAQTLRAVSSLEPQMARAAEVIDQCLSVGKKLLVCGNGGSATDASHFATELVVRFAQNRRALPAICLTSDSGILTAAGNDYGFDEVFARQVAAFGVPGDVLICLTTSGKSKNLIRALEEAKARKLKTIVFLGRDGGSTVGLADVDLLVKSDSTARVQEAHQLLLHVLCEIIELRLKE